MYVAPPTIGEMVRTVAVSTARASASSFVAVSKEGFDLGTDTHSTWMGGMGELKFIITLFSLPSPRSAYQ